MRQRADVAAAARRDQRLQPFPVRLSVSRSSGRRVPVPASDKLTIETPEQIALEFPLAGAGSRFLALAIDTLIQVGGSPCSSCSPSARGRSLRLDRCSARGSLAVLVIVAFTLYYGYFAVFEALWNGQTPGKRAVRLRVITSPAVRSRSTTRSCGTCSGSSTSCPASTPSACSRFFSRRGTSGSAISPPTPWSCTRRHSSAPIMQVASPTAGVLHGAAGSASTDAELLLVETFLQRRHELPPAVRETHAQTIADRLRARLGTGGTGHSIPKPLIEALHARARTTGRVR